MPCEVCEGPGTHCCGSIDQPMLNFCEEHYREHVEEAHDRNPLPGCAPLGASKGAQMKLDGLMVFVETADRLGHRKIKIDIVRELARRFKLAVEALKDIKTGHEQGGYPTCGCSVCSVLRKIEEGLRSETESKKCYKCGGEVPYGSGAVHEECPK